MQRLSSSLLVAALPGIADGCVRRRQQSSSRIRQDDEPDPSAGHARPYGRARLRAHRVSRTATYGLTIKNGKISPNDQQVASLVAEHGFAAKPGDRVIITNVEFKEKSIVLDINGGGKKHQKWYQHVSIGAGGTNRAGGWRRAAKPGGQRLDRDAQPSTSTFRRLTGEQVRRDARAGLRLQGADRGRGVRKDAASEGPGCHQESQGPGRHGPRHGDLRQRAAAEEASRQR